MPVKGSYLAIAGVGGILLWSGLRGKSWSDVIRQLIAGKDPATAQTTQAIAGTPMSAFSSQTGTGALTGPSGPAGTASGLAAAGEKYVGKVPYKWGGANPSGWDCSGAFNYWACHDSGMDIPGYKAGTFTGTTHGPNTFIYQGWLRIHGTKISRANVSANDVCLWQTHMGVATSNTQYVSAASPASGTCIQSIDNGGPSHEIPSFWRL